MIVSLTAYRDDRNLSECACKECACHAFLNVMSGVCRKCERGAHLPDFPATVSPIIAEPIAV